MTELARFPRASANDATPCRGERRALHRRRSSAAGYGALGFSLLVSWLLALSCSDCCAAEKPSKGKASRDDSTAKGLDNLGFSLAPREGGKARTSLFGIAAEGYKFVYVFDRSGSMGGQGRDSLRAVKAELLRSLKPLDTVHQFQIIFYNEKPVVFNPSGTPGRLAFATDENKQRAERFLETITADGGTAHEDALKMAIRLRPDVIFFLTDADDPKLSPEQLEKIQKMAAGIVINAIEFGAGPKPEGQSFLADLAQQNAGRYGYIDITKRVGGAKRAGK